MTFVNIFEMWQKKRKKKTENDGFVTIQWWYMSICHSSIWQKNQMHLIFVRNLAHHIFMQIMCKYFLAAQTIFYLSNWLHAICLKGMMISNVFKMYVFFSSKSDCLLYKEEHFHFWCPPLLFYHCQPINVQQNSQTKS